jgi:Zn-dependent protease
MSHLFSPPFLIAMLFALSFHEWAHAFAADRLGDSTARSEGRLTLNPLAHLDPMGTILFILIGFGWGKPVPFDPRQLKHPKRDSALIAAAGPFSNLVLSLLCFILLFLLFPEILTTGAISLMHDGLSPSDRVMVFFQQILLSSVFINLGLMAFNLLPVAPLDGSKIVACFVPLRFEDLFDEWMRFGPFIILGILLLERVIHFPFLTWWVSGIADAVFHLFIFVFP